MMGAAPAGSLAAYAGIRSMAHSHPGDPRYLLHWAQLMLRQRRHRARRADGAQQLVLARRWAHRRCRIDCWSRACAVGRRTGAAKT